MRPYDGVLTNEDLLMHCCSEEEHGHTIWNKLFSATLCKNAFYFAEDLGSDMANEVYVYFLMLYFAKSYARVEECEYYHFNICEAGAETIDLTDFSMLCRQSSALSNIESFLIGEGAMDKYPNVYDQINKYLITGCLWRWYYLLAPADSAAGFDLLLENWDNDDVIAFLSEMYFYNKEEILLDIFFILFKYFYINYLLYLI